MRDQLKGIVAVLTLLIFHAAPGFAHVIDALATDAQSTHKVISSGSWSNPATWGGLVPGPDARVIVPQGFIVTVDKEFVSPLFWVRVDGTLKFATNVNTSLTADSVFVNHGGRLEMGTAVMPVQPHVTARLIIKARNGKTIDHAWDPSELSRGLIAESPIEIHGAPKQSWSAVTTIPAQGSTTVTLDSLPSGWRVGDTLVLTAPEYGEDEVFTVTAIAGNVVTLNRPVTYARAVPRPGLALHMANLTRNVIIASADSSNLALHGHVMLMQGGHQIWHAGFYDLGRTTIRPVTDPLMINGVRDPSLMPLCGLTTENVRGRYAVHFHMSGTDSPQSTVEGSVVSVARGSGLKIGYINHSSNVAFRRNVSYQIDGSHFFTEEGDEVGEFVENLAIYSQGSGFPKDMQMDEPCNKTEYPAIFNRRRLDVGHRGHGFWLQAGGVDVIGNVSANQGSSTFDLWPRPLNYPQKTNTHHVQFPVAHLRDGGKWAAPKTAIGIDFVPALWRDNLGYVTSGSKSARNAALSIHYSGIRQVVVFPAAPKTLISGFRAWNTQNGIVSSYSGWIRFEDIELIAGIYMRKPTLGMGLGTQGGNNMDLVGVQLEGFKIPLKLGVASTCSGITADGVPVTCP